MPERRPERGAREVGEPDRLELAGVEREPRELAQPRAMPPRLARLKLRGNELSPQSLLQLADSPTLRSIAKLELDGNPYVYEQSVRNRLAQRFGVGWFTD